MPIPHEDYRRGGELPPPRVTPRWEQSQRSPQRSPHPDDLYYEGVQNNQGQSPQLSKKPSVHVENMQAPCELKASEAGLHDPRNSAGSDELTSITAPSGSANSKTKPDSTGDITNLEHASQPAPDQHPTVFNDYKYAYIQFCYFTLHLPLLAPSLPLVRYAAH